MRAREMWTRVQSKAGLAVIGGALLLTGVGVGTAAATGAIGTQTTSDATVVTLPASSSPAAAPVSTPAPAPVVAVTAPTSAATVQRVETTPAPAAVPAPKTTATPADNDGVGTLGPDGWYTPAPDAAGNVYAPMPPAPDSKLPGEPGYVPPAG